jgi:hypothetical protein
MTDSIAAATAATRPDDAWRHLIDKLNRQSVSRHFDAYVDVDQSAVQGSSGRLCGSTHLPHRTGRSTTPEKIGGLRSKTGGGETRMGTSLR